MKSKVTYLTLYKQLLLKTMKEIKGFKYLSSVCIDSL